MAEAKPGIQELVASCYRSLSAQEFEGVKRAYPDESILRQRLEWLKRDTGVSPDMGIGFFLAALDLFA